MAVIFNKSRTFMELTDAFIAHKYSREKETIEILLAKQSQILKYLRKSIFKIIFHQVSVREKYMSVRNGASTLWNWYESVIFSNKFVFVSSYSTFVFFPRALTPFFFSSVFRSVTFYIAHYQLVLTNAIFFVNSFFNQCQLLRWMTRDLVF